MLGVPLKISYEIATVDDIIDLGAFHRLSLSVVVDRESRGRDHAAFQLVTLFVCSSVVRGPIIEGAKSAVK
jgi:hypothetical protein